MIMQIASRRGDEIVQLHKKLTEVRHTVQILESALKDVLDTIPVELYHTHDFGVRLLKYRDLISQLEQGQLT